jgi:hypothetical protein
MAGIASIIGILVNETESNSNMPWFDMEMD